MNVDTNRISHQNQKGLLGNTFFKKLFSLDWLLNR